MLRSRLSSERLSRSLWWKSKGHHVRVAGCFLWGLAASCFVGLEGPNTLIWLANGLLLAYLLLAPRWRWPAYFAASFAAQIAAARLVGTQTLPIDVTVASLNMAEVAIAAFCLRKSSAVLPRFTNLSYLLRFLGVAVLAAPTIVGVCFAGIAHLCVRLSFWTALRDWLTTDALGMAVATPAFVAVFRTRFRETVAVKRKLLYPLLLAVVVVFSFQQRQIPTLFFIYPLLLLVLLQLRLGWAALGALFVTASGSWYTAHGSGPLFVAKSFGVFGPALRLHFMIAAAMFTLYMTSVVVENLRSTERKLRDTVYLHELVTQNSRDAIIVADFKGNRRYVSPAGLSWGANNGTNLLNSKSFDLLHPDDRAKAADIAQQLRAGRDAALLECRIRKADGTYHWVEASLRTIRDPVSGTPTGILNMVRDISERKHAEQFREFHQSLLGAIHEVSLDGVLVLDGDGKPVSYNRRFGEVWGLSMREVPANLLESGPDVVDEGLFARCVASTKDPEPFLKRVHALNADREASDQCQFELKDGRTLELYTTALRTRDGQYLGRAWFFRDITERKRAELALKAAYAEVEKLAVVDPLTGIANRRRFDECLTSEWRRGMRERQPLSMVLLDVDLFKLYNDTYGHVRGDSCLKQIAESAMDVVTRPGDLVARFGGEEFAIILPNTNEDGAVTIANEISAALRHRNLRHVSSPYEIVTISAGCATMIPQTRFHASDLIELADHAMYQAKRLGRNRVCTNRDPFSGVRDQGPGKTAVPGAVVTNP